MLHFQDLQEGKEDDFNDMKSIFTNIAINETIDYVLDQLYNKKKLKPFFSRLILELNTEVPFNINFCFFLA